VELGALVDWSVLTCRLGRFGVRVTLLLACVSGLPVRTEADSPTEPNARLLHTAAEVQRRYGPAVQSPESRTALECRPASLDGR